MSYAKSNNVFANIDAMAAQQNADASRYNAGQQGKLSGLLDTLGQQANQAAGQTQTNFNQFAPKIQGGFQNLNPTINTNFQQNGLDSFSQQILARGQQDLNNRVGVQQNNIMQRLGANNPAAAVMSEMAAMRGGLNVNPMQFQAAEQQVGRRMAEQSAGNQAALAGSQEMSRLRGLDNETAMAGAQLLANLAQMSNQGLAQKVGFQALPAAGQQNLLSVMQAAKSGSK